MKIDAQKVFSSIIEKSLNMTYYAEIMKSFPLVDAGSDQDFQRAYGYFYRVRRNQEWRSIYFRYMESCKTSIPSFKDALIYLYDKTGNVEPSFTTKLLATLNADLPIWDSIVLGHLGLELTGRGKAEKLENAVVLYDRLLAWYREYLQTKNAKESISAFDAALPRYRWLSDTKKIDFMMWGNRGE